MDAQKTPQPGDPVNDESIGMHHIAVFLTNDGLVGIQVPKGESSVTLDPAEAFRMGQALCASALRVMHAMREAEERDKTHDN